MLTANIFCRRCRRVLSLVSCRWCSVTHRLNLMNTGNPSNCIQERTRTHITQRGTEVVRHTNCVFSALLPFINSLGRPSPAAAEPCVVHPRRWTPCGMKACGDECWLSWIVLRKETSIRNSKPILPLVLRHKLSVRFVIKECPKCYSCLITLYHSIVNLEHWIPQDKRSKILWCTVKCIERNN
jgi:hypothetical protein